MKRFTVLASFLCCAGVALGQANNNFLPATGVYGTAANWSLGHVPDSNDVAVISVTNNATATNSAGTFAAGSLLIGSASRTGALVVTGGQLSYGAASVIGTNGSSANLINAGGALIFSNGLTLATSTGTATYASLTNNSGTVRVEGSLQLGVHNGSGGGARGLLTVNGGTVTVTGNLATCNAVAYSYIRLNGGALEVAGITHGGSATERVLFFNGGTLRALRDNAGFLPTAAFAVQMTNSVQNGGVVLDSQGFSITVATPFLQAAGQTGGLTKVGAGLLDLTANSTFTGATRVAAGTLRITGSGSLYNGGTLAGRVFVEPGATFLFARSDSFGNHASSAPVVIDAPTNAVVLNTNTFNTIHNLALRGGELRVLGGSGTTFGSYQLKGTVTASGDSTSLISAPGSVNSSVYIQVGNNAAGGQTTFQVADGAASVDLQVEAPLSDGRNAGNTAYVPSGFIKSGDGVMRLTSNSTFTGTASVNAGVLALGANASVIGEVAVASGAVVDVTAKSSWVVGSGQTLRGSGLVTGNVTAADGARIQSGGVGTPGTLTVAGNVTLSGSYTNVFDLTNSLTAGGGVNDLLVVNGDLDGALSAFRVNALAPLVSGTYRLIEYTGAETLPFSPVVVGLNTRDSLTILDVGTGVVELAVTAGTLQDLRWNPVVDGNWNFASSNWVDLATGMVTDRFYDSDAVFFDDAGAFGATVTVSTAVRPVGVTVNSSSNYLIQGTGRIQDRIGGATALVKDGAGRLTLGNMNEFTGGIVVSNGTVVAAAPASVGGGSITLRGGGVALATAMTLTNPVVLSAAAGEVDDLGNATTLSGPVSGTGALVKRGGGTLTMPAANSYTGGTVISQGTVRQAVPGALGTNPGPITLGDASSGTNAVAWRFAGATVPSNAIAVTALGTGPASLGSYSGGIFTEHRGPISLARAVTLVDATGDRTSFAGPVSGSPGLIVISGSRITIDNASNSFVAGLLINGGSIYQNNSTSALPASTTITNNGSFRLNNGGRHVVDVFGGTGTVDIVAGGVSTLSLGNGNGSDVFAGRIVNGASALSLEKRGTGVQTLSNTNTYTGTTTILDGTLALSGAAVLSGTPQIQAGAAGTFDVSARTGYTLAGNQTLFGRGTVTGAVVTAAGAQIRPDGFSSVHTLTFKNRLGLNAGSTNWFDLTDTLGVGGGTNDLVVVDGLLEPSNSVINLNFLQIPASGTYTLFTYTGVKGTTFNPAFVSQGASLGRKVAALDETTSGQVNLVVTGAPANLVWLPQTNANWNFVDNNWSNVATAALDTFFQNDTVTLDERGAYSNVVTLTTTTQPAAVTVAGSSNYFFRGLGGLGGIGALTKDGAGELTLRNTNSYSGLTIISNGVVNVGGGAQAGAFVGTGTIQIAGSGTLIHYRADVFSANVTMPRSIVGAGNWIVRGNGGSLTSDYSITGSQTGFTGTLTIDKARFQANAVTDPGYATINVLTGGQFWAQGAGNVFTNAITIAGQGWQEGALYGAIRLQNAGVNYAGPIVLANGARIGAISSENWFTNTISGGYDLETYSHDGNSRLVLSGNNTFKDLRLVSQWTYLTKPSAIGTGRVVMVTGGFSPLGADLTVTNDLRAESSIAIGYHPTSAERRSTIWVGNWDLNGAGRIAYLYNTNYMIGAITNGVLEVAENGLMVFSNDVRVSQLYINYNGVNGNARQDGGTVTVANAAGDAFRIGHWGTVGTYTMNGGVLSNANGRISVGWDGTGTLTINGGAVYSPWVRMDDLGTDNPGRLNLNGGALWLGASGISNDGTGYTVNLEGGTLGAYASWASVINFNVNATNGGAAIDTAANDIALHGTLTGTGTLQKVGAGVLALNRTYAAGPLSVTAGTLAGTGVVNAAVTAAAGSAIQPGSGLAAGALTASSVTFAADAQFNPLVNGTASLLRVTATNGFVVPTGAGQLKVNLLSTPLVVGTRTLIDYEGAIQGGADTNIVLLSYPPRSVMYLTNNTVNTSIDLVIVSLAEPIKWLGAVDNVWNINSTSNWLTQVGALTTAYLQVGIVGDAVLFDDTALANFSVSVATNVSPAALTVSNEINDYTLSGAFGIGGVATLTKHGAARLTVNTSNSYAGGTVILGGTVQVGSGGASGSLGSGAITNSGQLIFNHADQAAVTQIISGTGPLSKQGSGNLTLGAINTYTNLTTVDGGTLTLAANAVGSGTLSGPLTINTGATVVASVGNALGYAGTPWVRTININDGILATAVAGLDNGWGLTINMNGGSITSLVAGGFFSMGLGGAGFGALVNTLATDHPAWISADLRVRDNTPGGIAFAVARGSAATDLEVSGRVQSQSSGGIAKSGTGIMVLSGTNNYTGHTTINGGTLLVTDAGKLYHGAYQATAVLTVRSNAVLDIATWSYSEPGAESLGGLRANSDAIVIDAGVIRMRKTTSYYRGLTVGAAGARLEPSTNAVWTLPYTSTAAIISSSGGSLVLAGVGTGVLEKIFPGTGGIVKDEAGLWVLGATNTYSGTTTISNGILLVNGTSGGGAVTVHTNGVLGGSGVVRGAVLQNGAINPGTGLGTLTVSNTLTSTGTATTRFELGGTNAPTDYDQLIVSDVHTPAGLLEVVTTNGYVPASGDAFLIISNSALGGALFGTFNTESLPALASGLGWVVQYNGTESVGLLVTGTVASATAYELWAQSITNPALRGEQEDPDGDGYANLFEYSQGSDATNAADNAKLHLARTNGQFLAAFNRVNTATDIVYEVEGAYAPTNGALWLGIATNAIGSWGSSTNVNDNDTATIHRVWVTDLELGTNRTLRLKITRP